jgi:hypothetical protein
MYIQMPISTCRLEVSHSIEDGDILYSNILSDYGFKHDLSSDTTFDTQRFLLDSTFNEKRLALFINTAAM